jgi:hypothetical protein
MRPRPVCRYCRCDALEQMPNRDAFSCLVCLRIESTVDNMRRNLAGKVLIPRGFGFDVVASPFTKSDEVWVLRYSDFALAPLSPSLLLRNVTS